MQHQYWKTKQALSQKLGRKEDECIVSSDAFLDTKLEFFGNIQSSCTFIQKIIDKYQESICYLSQEINSLGRFLKENSGEDKTHEEDIMLSTGKSLIFCAQQQLFLHEPLSRFHHELETFCQRAIGDTIRNILTMEKARTEYRASLSWMKNVSQQLDPDTSKQLEKFKKVQNEVRRGKEYFDKQALDCIQKVDLLAAARCNMMNHALSFYQSKLISCLEKSAETFFTLNQMFMHYIKENSIEKTGFKNSTLDNAQEYEGERKSSADDSHIIESKLEQEKANFLLSTCDKLLSENDFGLATELNTTKSIKSDIKSTEDELRASELFCISELQNFKQPLADLIYIPGNNTSIHTKNDEATNMPLNFENDDTFLPSAILLQSLDLSKNFTMKEDKNKCINAKHNDSLNQKANTWMNLFNDLDPLSKSSESSTVSKNSFV